MVRFYFIYLFFYAIHVLFQTLQTSPEHTAPSQVSVLKLLHLMTRFARLRLVIFPTHATDKIGLC